VTRNPPDQYTDDRNLRARQDFWRHQDPYFDDVAWILGLAAATACTCAACGTAGSRRSAATCRPGCSGRPLTRNAAAQLGVAFATVSCVRPARTSPVVIRPAAIAAGHVASLASHHQDETARPWADVTEDVRRQVQAVIDAGGAFVTSGDLAAFICR
jgi:hypothetical protein